MQIHDNAATVSDYLALSRGRRLEIVLMQVDGKRTLGKAAFHQNTGRVLYIDLQFAPVSSESVDAAGNSEQRIEVVELVDLRKYNTTAEISARRIHLAIILVRMTIGEIFTNRG